MISRTRVLGSIGRGREEFSKPPDDARCRDSDRRDIDADPKWGGGRADSLKVPERERGLGRYVLPDVGDVAGRLGEGEELCRQEQAPQRMLPSHERFEADDSASGELDNRLVVDDQFPKRRKFFVLLGADALAGCDAADRVPEIAACPSLSNPGCASRLDGGTVGAGSLRPGEHDHGDLRVALLSAAWSRKLRRGRVARSP